VSARRTSDPASRLVTAAVQILESGKADSIFIEELLDNADTSYQVLYQEFGGLDGLLDSARLAQVAIRTRLSIAMVEQALGAINNFEDVITQIKLLTTAIRGETFRENRLIRSAVIGSTLHRPELRDALGEMQNELTNRIAELLQSGIDRGLFRCAVSPRAFAVFVQAYTAGQILDEIDHTHIDVEEWTRTVDIALRGLILPSVSDDSDGGEL
jgi:AcrR family transcriptional regulator